MFCVLVLFKFEMVYVVLPRPCVMRERVARVDVLFLGYACKPVHALYYVSISMYYVMLGFWDKVSL